MLYPASVVSPFACSHLAIRLENVASFLGTAVRKIVRAQTRRNCSLEAISTHPTNGMDILPPCSTLLSSATAARDRWEHPTVGNELRFLNHHAVVRACVPLSCYLAAWSMISTDSLCPPSPSFLDTAPPPFTLLRKGALPRPLRLHEHVVASLLSLFLTL